MSSHSHADHSAPAGDPTFTARKRSTIEVLRRVWKYLLPYKILALATVGCAVLSLLCALTYPKLTGYIIDGIIEKSEARLNLLFRGRPV